MLLSPLTCTWNESTPRSALVLDQECSGTWNVHSVLGVIGALVHVPLYMAIAVKDVEVSDTLSARPGQLVMD